MSRAVPSSVSSLEIALRHPQHLRQPPVLRLARPAARFVAGEQPRRMLIGVVALP